MNDPRWRSYEVPPTSNANFVCKFSENGFTGFVLANDALSSVGEEHKTRRKLIENGALEAILILLQNMFNIGISRKLSEYLLEISLF